jgi:hypothetical protein
VTHFEYITIFTSFLYAIMVGRIVNTLAGLGSGRMAWRHVAWLVILLVNLAQTWWIGWSGHDFEYTYGFYILSLALAVPLMFSVAVLTPTNDPEDWVTYLASSRVRFFVAYGIFWLMIGLSNYLGGGEWRGPIVPFIMSVVGASVVNRYVQIGTLIFFATAFMGMGIRLALE